jgi:hypothetical protein
MNTATAERILTKKETGDLYEVAPAALKSHAIRELLVEGSFAKDETFRYNSVRVLYRALSAKPGLFYEYWDRFAEKIDSPNSFHRSIAAQAIALLTPADTHCRLDLIFKRYMALLDDPKVMAAHYFLETLPVVYTARPDLRKAIVTGLLRIDKTGHTVSRRDLLKADILAVFDRVFGDLPPVEAGRIRAFVTAQLRCTSPKTRKAAANYLAAHPA